MRESRDSRRDHSYVGVVKSSSVPRTHERTGPDGEIGSIRFDFNRRRAASFALSRTVSRMIFFVEIGPGRICRREIRTTKVHGALSKYAFLSLAPVHSSFLAPSASHGARRLALACIGERTNSLRARVRLSVRLSARLLVRARVSGRRNTRARDSAATNAQDCAERPSLPSPPPPREQGHLCEFEYRNFGISFSSCGLHAPQLGCRS